MTKLVSRKRLCLATLFALSISGLAQGHQQDSGKNGIVLQGTGKGAFPSSRIKPLVLPDGRIVVSVADTVYMLAADGILQWKYSTEGETFMSEPAYNAELNEIAFVGYDLLFVRVDAKTGKRKWKANTVGRATFAGIAAFGRGYLVVADMSGYRETASDRRLPDRLEYWTDSEDEGWTTDFPKGAELVVSGDRIYSLNRGKDKIRLREIHIPTSREKLR